MADGNAPHNEDRPEMARRVVRALRRYATETDLYVAAAGRSSAMHHTDLKGLALVMDWGLEGDPATPGRLSTALQLSPAATSAMLDRLERHGHITRATHPLDHRSVVVEITEHAMEVGGQLFGRLAQHLGPVLARHSEQELILVARFLEDAGAATIAARNDTLTHRS
ncbi:MarR family transcriptional regulator [Nocardioidaceae bacterium SCSIO 66511]|nr:MarR family transcriptional regulator [Nocardioidaceae bacterium SCSIO 66511]